MPDDLRGQLEARRASLITANRELLSAAQAANNGAGRDLDADEETRYQGSRTEIRKLNERLDDLSDEAGREERARASRAGSGASVADDGGSGARPAASVQVLSEPTTYGAGSGHSYFLDMARAELRRGDGDGGPGAAAERMKRHSQEIDKLMPARREAVQRRASQRYEEAFASSVKDQQRLSQMEREGISPFEKRFISRTDGQGGYFVPPLWLVDEFVPYLRAGRVFADMWRNFPLPSGTDSINIPRITTGTATGPQTADGGAVPGRDIQDNFVNALVRTVAGQQDAAIQLLDQSPVAFDQIIFADLMADYAMQLSAQLMIGSGSNGQLTGLYPAGTLGSSTGASNAGYVVNNAANAWTAAAGTANFYTSTGQLVSTISRTRFRPPTGAITNPAVWYASATSVDSQNRPLVVAAQSGLGYNQMASDGYGPQTEGPVGHILGLPWSVDPNIPITFGGTTAPYIGAISNGNTAPVPGTGGNPDYTPFIAAVWDDLYLWEGEMRSRVLQEVLSGTLQVRFQVYGYAASMPNRYQDSSGHPVSYGNYNTVGTTSSVLSTAGLLSGF